MRVTIRNEARTMISVTAFLCWISYLLLRTERAAEAREREHEEARR
jgi:hypothetical protein